MNFRRQAGSRRFQTLCDAVLPAVSRIGLGRLRSNPSLLPTWINPSPCRALAAIEMLEERRLLAGQHAGLMSAQVTNSIVPDAAPIAGSTTKLAASPTVSGVGTPVTLTATVTSPGNTVNSGSVTFKSGATVLGSPSVVNGTASIQTSALPAGTDTVEANYAGGTGFATSSDTTTETVALVVNTTQDPTTLTAGTLSLRQAINNANESGSAQTIIFDPTVFATPQTISLTFSELAITGKLTIDGPSVGVTVSRDSAQSAFRILQVDTQATATLDHLTIKGGSITGNGGGIFTDSNSSLTLTNSTIESNTATGAGGSGNGFGGGIDALGVLNIANCLFESNTASIEGGGIEQDATMDLMNSTFQGNSAGIAGGMDVNHPATITNCTFSGNIGGGIFVNAGGTLTLNNTIIAGNTSRNDLTGNTAVGSNNLIGDGSSSNITNLTNTVTGDPKLNGLADNGGPTFTMSLQSNSPALDKGSDTLAVDQNGTALSFDQRGTGFARKSGSHVDIGAYEAQIPSVTSVNSLANDGSYGGGADIHLTVQFDQPVTVTGFPEIHLNNGGLATFVNADSPTVLDFRYFVMSGQNTAKLDEASTTALDPNDGTITSTDGFNAIVTLPAPGSANSLSANSSIAVDTTAPTVTNVNSTTANGTYGSGANIDIEISFSKAVAVTGTPQLALNSGGTASYSSGNGTSTLTFTYPVGASDSAADLDETSTSALTLNGGKITDTVDTDPNNAELTLPAPGAAGSLGANKSIKIATAETPSMVVTTTSDVVNQFDGLTSLREAVNYANTFPAQQVVTFDPSLAGKTIKLGIDGDDTYGASALAITGQVIIDGLTGSSGITIARDTTAAPNRLRLFYVAPGARLALEDLTITGGLAKGGNSQGGGGGAGLGGAVLDAGTLTVIDCTFESNEATGGNSTAGTSNTGGGGGLGGDGLGTDGGSPNGGQGGGNGGLGGGGSMIVEERGGAGGFGGGGSESFGDTAGAGGFGGGSGGADPTGFANTNAGFGAGAGNKSNLGGGGAGMGGAIFSNGGTVKIINSTFTDNSATGGTGANNGQGLGGAIFNRDGGLTIINSTLSADTANQGGLEVYSLGDGDHSGSDPVTASSASARINNSILAQAIDPNADEVNPDFVSNTNDSGTSTSSGTNDLFNGTSGFGGTVTDTADPMLAGITNNGGPTSTMALETNSPAIDKGSNALAVSGEPLAFDQRGAGFARVMGSSVDIGAFEVQVPATVTSVSSPDPNVTYGFGATISVVVSFNETVNVTGTPQLALNSGGTASYASGSGSSSLTFSYTVGAGQNSSDLDEASSSALTLNGGTIDDAAGKAATLTLPAPGAAGSLGANEAIAIDTTAPTISSVTSALHNTTIGKGDHLNFAVTFNDNVYVTGTPQFSLNSGGTASYESGSGTNVLTFGYDVGAGDSAATLDETSTSALKLNGGTITDAASNPADLTLPTAGSASSLATEAISVDAVPPTVTNFDPGTSTGTVGTEIDYKVTFSEPIMGGVSMNFINTGTAGISIGTVAGNGTNTLTVPVTPNTAGTIVLKIASNGNITDAVGNPFLGSVVDTHTVTVPNPDHAPTDIQLTPNSLPENAEPPVAVGTLTDTDPDHGDTATYKLVSGTGSDNNKLFYIVNDLVIANTTFNFDVKNTYTIRVQVTDSAGMTFSKPLTINILDEAPTPHNDTASTMPDKPVTINVLANDTGPKGDTLSLVNNTNPANGIVTVSGNKYIYTPNTGFHGVDSFVYRIKDTHGVTATATVTITVGSGVGVGKDPVDSSVTDLDVVGTSSADNIKVVYGGSQGKVQVFFGNTNEGTFNFTGRILVYGQGGNDTITIDSHITRSAWIWGENGNDTINGGGGNDVLFGGDGDDSVSGNAGRDILIGDDGADKLNGGAGDDLLIAGDFTISTSMSQFASVQKEWTRTDKSYSSRVKDLTTGGGYNSIKLNSSTLFSSTTLKDYLTGGSDSDLFFAAMTGDKITDKASGETAVNIG